MDQHSRILERARRGKLRAGLPDSPPKFGIGHLLLWTACCAAYLAIVRAIAVDEPGFVGFLILLLLAMIEGASWAGLAIFISRRFRGVRWPIEPGEWLLAIFGARLLVEAALKSVLSETFDHDVLILMGATSCLLIVPAFSRHLAVMWRICFCLMAVVYALPVFSTCLAIWLRDPIPNMFVLRANILLEVVQRPILSLAVLAIFAIYDLRSRSRHGWLHFVGLGVCCTTLAARIFVAMR